MSHELLRKALHQEQDPSRRAMMLALQTITLQLERLGMDTNTIKQSVADIKTDVANIGTIVTAEKATVDQTATDMVDLQARVKALQDKANGDNPDLDEIVADLAKIHTDLGTAAATLSTSSSKLGGVDEAVTKVAAVDVGGGGTTTTLSITGTDPAQPAGAGGSTSLKVLVTGAPSNATVKITTEGTDLVTSVQSVDADGVTVSVDFGGFVGEAEVSIVDGDGNALSNAFSIETI